MGSLTHATLTGLVEYALLRRSFAALPDLPAPLAESTLGRHLAHSLVRAKAHGSTSKAHQDLSHEPRLSEVTVVRDTEDLLSEPTDMLLVRATQAVKKAGFSVRTANQFQGALSEMLSNAIEHSASPMPVVVGYHVRPEIASFVVADVGRGIFDTLAENPAHRGFSNHCQAIRAALRDGVSRFKSDRGNGFRPIFQSLVEHWGTLRFRSRTGCLTMDGTALDADQGTDHFPPELPGFQVSVTCRSGAARPEFPLI